jgi:hypothetical protein
MKSWYFVGEKMEIVQHVLRNAVSVHVVLKNKIYSLGSTMLA